MFQTVRKNSAALIFTNTLYYKAILRQKADGHTDGLRYICSSHHMGLFGIEINTVSSYV